MNFAFEGTHYIANFKRIRFFIHSGDSKFSITNLIAKTLQECGATIIECKEHIFPNGGMTAIFLLSESHCTIHTYPEHGSFFIDAFTCGGNFDTMRFHQILCDVFEPAEVTYDVLLRN